MRLCLKSFTRQLRRRYVLAKWMFLEASSDGYATLVNFTRNSPESKEALHQAAEDAGIRLVSSVAASTESSSPEAVTASIAAHAKNRLGARRLRPAAGLAK